MKLVPVRDKNGEIQLYDIYIEDEWYGSRTTIEQILHIYGEDSEYVVYEPTTA